MHLCAYELFYLLQVRRGRRAAPASFLHLENEQADGAVEGSGAARKMADDEEEIERRRTKEGGRRMRVKESAFSSCYYGMKFLGIMGAWIPLKTTDIKL